MKKPAYEEKPLIDFSSTDDTEVNPEETKSQLDIDPLVLEDPDLAHYIFEGDSEEEIEELVVRKSIYDADIKQSKNGIMEYIET